LIEFEADAAERNLVDMTVHMAFHMSVHMLPPATI